MAFLGNALHPPEKTCQNSRAVGWCLMFVIGVSPWFQKRKKMVLVCPAAKKKAAVANLGSPIIPVFGVENSSLFETTKGIQRMGSHGNIKSVITSNHQQP